MMMIVADFQLTPVSRSRLLPPECTILEKDRDGCPKIVNLGTAKTDLFYERKKFGFKKRQ